ncbi:MAG6090-like repeat-containing lipoprotein [Mycoplasma mycoides]|nr:lipoprotein [Mycoplasma mycoides]
MKKLLTILGSIMISTSGAALVIACKTPSAKQPTNSDKNPSNNDDSSNPSGSGENKEPENTKPSESTTPTNPINPKQPNKPDTPKPKPGEKDENETKPKEPITPNEDKKPDEPKNPETKPNGSTTPVIPKKPDQPVIPSSKPVIPTTTWYSVYHDSATGADINLNPTKEQIEKEEKRLEDWVKEYLDKNKRENQALFDYLIKIEYDRIFRDSATGADINLNPSSESIDKENKRLDDLVKEEIKRVKEYNLNIHKQNIYILKEEITDLKSDRFVSENEFNKKQKDLEDAFNKFVLETNENYKVYKSTLDKQLKETETKINDLKTEMLKTNIKSESIEAKKTLEDLKELLEESKSLFDQSNKKATEHNEEVTKASELQKKIEAIFKDLNIKKGLIDSLPNIENEKQTTKKEYDDQIKEEKDFIKEMDEDDKLIKRILDDLVSDKNFSEWYVYSDRLIDGFNHQYIARLKDAMWSNKHEKTRINKLVKELEKEQKEKLDQLEKTKNEAEKAKKEVPMLEEKSKEMQAELEKTNKHLLEINNEIIQNNEDLKMYKDEVQKFEQALEFVLKKEAELSKKLSEQNKQLTNLLAQKQEIEKALSELEISTAKAISDATLKHDEEILEIDKLAYQKETSINKKIDELEKLITKIEEVTREIQKQ